jgi:hypothetical protein
LREKAGLGNQLIPTWPEETREDVEKLLQNTYTACVEIPGRDHEFNKESEIFSDR